MANLAATVAALEKYCGLPAARTRTVARRLLEEQMLTPGAPGVAVEISFPDFALLLLALASGAPLRTVAAVTASLADCVPEGVDVDIMPARVRPAKRTAFDVLHDLVWNSAHGAGQMKFDVEVVETWREVAFHRDGEVVRFAPAGRLAAHWQTGQQRRSTRIPSAALHLAARSLFGEK